MDFSPQQKYNLLSKMGYSGSPQSDEMDAFIQSSPKAASLMGKFSRVVKKRAGMAVGGSVNILNKKGDSKNQNTTPTTPAPTPEPTPAPAPQLTPGQVLEQQLIQDPSKLAVKADVATMTATPETLIAEGVGQATAPVQATTTTVDNVSTAAAPEAKPAATVDATTVAGDVKSVADATQAVQGTVSEAAKATAAQQTTSSLEGMQAAQGTGILMDNPVQREIQAGEMISGSTVDAAKVNQLAESIQAAEATPTKQATVQGQLEGLMQQFEGGATPAWAAGAMRNAQAMLAQRGLGASSVAGQAVIQAAMESALPIAQADATTRAQFESQNLSNRQQVAMFAAQQRAAFLGQEFDQNFQTRVANAAKVSDIANMNFTAEQNIALENSRIVNTVNLENLSNRQAMTMAQAAALSNLDITNLNNRQQAAVQNAQAFLQMDMANLDNAQQTSIFRSTSNINALLTDQAAKNAAKQFNAASENQTNQFYDGLAANASQFNTQQTNAMNQFNAGETNALEKFNATLEEQRQQFNASNSLVIAQANAVWRQNIDTLNTSAQNQANAEYAKTENGLSARAMDEIWQTERDLLAFSFTSAESEKDRVANLLIADKNLTAQQKMAADANSTAESAAKWQLAGSLIIGGW